MNMDNFHVFSLFYYFLITITISAEGQFTASFYWDSNCSQPFASSIPYPTYLQWSSLPSKYIHNNQSARVCVSPSISPVSEGSYDCMSPLVINGSTVFNTGSLQVAEWFTPGHCYTDTDFTQPDQSFTIAFTTTNACSPASYRNSSGGLSLYAKTSCPVSSTAVTFTHSTNLLLIIAFSCSLALHFGLG
jgi:hypothetical protein